jgi:hypothetical protein
MNMICTVWGHNWVLQSNEDGTGHWQECERCGKKNSVISGGRVM